MVKCCDVLKGKMLNQNKIGFSVYTDDESTYLKFSSVDTSEVDNFLATMKKSYFEPKPQNIKISGEVIIRFCPFCGEKIK